MTWFLIALLSSVLSALAAVTQKKVLFELEALAFSYYLSIANLLFSLPLFLFIDYGEINLLNLGVLFIKSVFGVAAFWCVMISLKNLEISKALPLLALTPGFVAIFAFIFLNEALTGIEITGLMLLLAGTYILESRSLREIFSPVQNMIKSRYHRYILIALLLFTASSVMDKLLVAELKLSPLAFTAFQHLAFALLFGLLYFVNGTTDSKGGNKLNKGNIIWIAIIAILTIGYRYTHIYAVSLASVALVLAVKRTSVFWATIIGGRIFKESNLVKKSIAVLLIVGGSILILK
ncbi:MAG: DMT family transporter [Melioribacteraceae bacterium]|nr:DMT family transporter [Melioribacteraceae bacterium]